MARSPADRPRGAAKKDTYSRVVSWLKVVLPLLALVGLSTLFLFARTINPAQDIPFADVDIDKLTADQRIGRPTFSGVTGGGAAFTLSADEAHPDTDGSGRITATEVSARIDLPDGPGIDVAADSARVAPAAKTAGLSGNVHIESTDGYAMTAEMLDIDYDALRLWSEAGITASGQGVDLTAGAFEMTGDGSDEAPYLLVFKDKVKLVYTPDN